LRHVECGAGLVVEAAQGLGGALHLRRIAAQLEVLAATGDRDVEAGLDLADVLIQHATQIGQPHVVRRAEAEVERARPGRPGRGRFVGRGQLRLMLGG
jgi:hypothetical protein